MFNRYSSINELNLPGFDNINILNDLSLFEVWLNVKIEGWDKK